MPTADKMTLISALGIRLILAPFTGHWYDLPIWFETGNIVAQLKSPYDILRPIGYAGIWPIWLGASSATAALISPGNSYVYDLLIKLPIIAVDFAIPGIIVRLVQEARPGNQLDTLMPKRVSRAYLLNPFVIIAGSVWAMPDNIIAAGILLTVREIRRAKPAGFALSLSSLIKPYPVVLLPPILRHLRKRSLGFVLSFFSLTGAGLLVPVVLLRVNPLRLLEVVFSQTFRFPNAISPFAIAGNLSFLFPQVLTPQTIAETLVFPWPVRYLWLESLLVLTVLLFIPTRPWNIKKLLSWMRIFLASYYLLFEAVSEQTLIPFAVLSLVDTDPRGHLGKMSTYWLVSATVTAFLAIDVPVWRFAYPIATITIASPAWNLFQAWGLIVLRVLFAIVMLRDARMNWKALRQT
jgi:hypothetical protein